MRWRRRSRYRDYSGLVAVLRKLFPELPSLRGWVEAMSSLGRLIFFDQPGTGASDPVTSGALPTLEQLADSITAVLDDLGSREAVLLAVDGGPRAGGALRSDTSVSHNRAGSARGKRGDPQLHRRVRSGRSHRFVGCHVGDRGVPTCGQPGHAVERGDPGSVGSN